VTAALFNFPTGVAVDSSGNVYVADSDNDLIREISPGGVVSTIAGQLGVIGATNGPALSASFNGPMGIAVDSSGGIYVADWGNDLIRKISP
jgi:DNA-binding beta-propeller fold protein YncE